MSARIEELVAGLPEVYQAIIGHPELSGEASRQCADRFTEIAAVHDQIRLALGRELRVLDLGCSQGYFSLSLARKGAVVVGVDYLEANIEVCRSLAEELGLSSATFQTGMIEDTISTIETGDFDLVLGLSVFHHLIHGSGIARAKALIQKLSQAVPFGLYEFALGAEPVAWAPSQPERVRTLLDDYNFVHELARFPTHLSQVSRPLYYASNTHWYVQGGLTRFDRVLTTGNQLIPGQYEGTRRTYLSSEYLLKKYWMDLPDSKPQNYAEWSGEEQLLAAASPDLLLPKLVCSGEAADEVWLVRELIHGRPLDDLLIANEVHDAEKIARDVVGFLVKLERQGLYHTDLRAWNVVVAPEGAAQVIDFGSIASERKDSSWPFDPFLSLVVLLRQIFHGGMEFPVPVQSAWLDPAPLPQPFRSAVLSLYSRPPQDWSFSTLAQALDFPPEAPEPPPIARQSFELIISTQEVAISELRRHSEWLEAELKAATKNQDELARTIEVHVGEIAAAQNQCERLEAELKAATNNQDELARTIEAQAAQSAAVQAAAQAAAENSRVETEQLQSEIARMNSSSLKYLRRGMSVIESQLKRMFRV